MPSFDVLRVLDDPESPDVRRGFVLIAVPRSPAAPHAVLINNALRYPRRNGSTTRYMSEPEVAAAYRDRLQGAEQQGQRIEQVEREALDRIDRTDRSWLVITLVPDLAGSLDITEATYDRFRQNTLAQQPMIVPSGWTYGRARVGRRRLLADSGLDSPLAQHVSLDLHADGAGSWGIELNDISRDRNPDVPTSWTVSDEVISLAGISGTLRLAQHARDGAGAGGNVVVRAALVPAQGASVQIGHDRFGIAEPRGQVAVQDEVVLAEVVAALENVAAPGSPLIATAAAR